MNIEILKQNEYFAQRWWELERLDYLPDIEVCLISCEDTMALKKDKIMVDVRSFEEYQECHLKSSHHMDPS